MTAIEQLQAAIAERHQQITQLEYAIAILQAPAGTIAVPVAECRVVEPPAKKSPPPVAVTRPEGQPKPPLTTGKRAERIHQIAKLLADRGPMAFKLIAEATGINQVSLGDYLKESECFAKTDPTNRLSPWTLTESGRKLASSAAPG